VLGGVQRPIARETKRASTAPAGGVQTSAADLARWMRFHLNDGVLDGRRFVSDSAMREMHSPQVIIATTPEMRRARLVEFFAAYGMGWQVMDYRGHLLLWHSGNGDGQIAYMALLPRERLGVAVLVNTWAAPFVHGALASRILDFYLGVDSLRDWSGEALARAQRMLSADTERWRQLEGELVPGSHPPRPLASYVGTYADSLFGDLVVRLERGGLTLQMGRGEVADLAHHHGDTFLVRWRDPLFREEFATLVEFTADGAAVRRLSTRINRDSIVAGRRM
jgi:hypothetical protein